MPLVDLNVLVDESPLPQAVRAYLAGADEALTAHDGRIISFVPSNYELVYGVLRALAASVHIRGTRFCEWGSGIGVVAGLAALLDFESSGIETEGELVLISRQLAEEFDVPVDFVHGSFIPHGAESIVHSAGSYSWMTTESDGAYDELELDPSDLDVVYAYSWPDEEETVAALFERYCGPGAVLVTYHGEQNFRVRRKVRRKVKASRSGR
jgi:hypothetical protein